jgi:hypothetical protein
VAAGIGNTIQCTVKEVVKQGSTLVALTVSGGRVVCPTIVAPGDRISVDAVSGQYLSRTGAGLK